MGTIGLKSPGFWFFENQLMAYMDLFSFLVGYDFDESDEYAIHSGLRDTDPMKESWFEYPIIGEVDRLELHLASESGTGVIECRVDGSDSLMEKVHSVCLVMDVLRYRFHLLPTKFYDESICRELGREVPVYRRKDS